MIGRLFTPKWQSTAGFVFGKNDSVADDLRAKYGEFGDLLGLYADHQGPEIHKWHHYLPIYERYFGALRGRPLRFLEIGVAKGGSLEMWRRYFGESALIYGIDIDPACADFDGVAAQVRIGSQADVGFLNRVIDEMGGVDVVLDDGSHQMDHIRTSLKTLYPRLSVEGLYMIEDLQTAYWRKFGGGYRKEANFFNDVRSMIDDMHHWYHDRPVKYPEMKGFLAGLHIHDSIVVLDKAEVHRPTHSWVGTGSPFSRKLSRGDEREETDGALL
jgi:hypothetical protein